MNPNQSQFPPANPDGFKDGVKVIPGGSQTPTQTNSQRFPWSSSQKSEYRVVTPPAEINSSKGGAGTGQYVRGEQLGGRGGFMQDIPPVPRPKPNQGTVGTGGVVIGGEKPGAVKITGPNPTIPKPPGRIASFFGGMRGGSGGGGGLFGIKNK
jgi:hypothetical protein